MKTPYQTTPLALRPEFQGERDLKGRPTAHQKTQSEQKLSDNNRLRYLMGIVSQSTGIQIEDIVKPTRAYARAARARQICMYLAYTSYQWTLARVGKAFGRDRTTVGYACRLIEDLRDDPQFDRQIEVIEDCLRHSLKSLRLKLLAPNLTEMARGGR